jgi:hypothetical protein
MREIVGDLLRDSGVLAVEEVQISADPEGQQNGQKAEHFTMIKL